MQAQRAIVNYRLSRTIFTRVLRGTSTSFSIILPRCLTPFNVFHVEHQATTTHSYLRIAYLAEPASVLQVQVTRRRHSHQTAPAAATAVSPKRCTPVVVPSNLVVSHASHADAAARRPLEACNTWTDTCWHSRHRRLRRELPPAIGREGPSVRMRRRVRDYPRQAILTIRSWRLEVRLCFVMTVMIVMICAGLLDRSTPLTL